MGSASPLFASPLDCNFYGYRIVDNTTAKQAENVTASFRYKGYEIAFSTYYPGGAKVLVLRNKALIGEYGTVEAAATAINEITTWNSGLRVSEGARANA